MGNFEWYNDYPNQCPPIGAFEDNVSESYRLVIGNPLCEEDFFPNNKTKNQKKDYADCGRWCVSFLCSLDGLKQLQQLVPAFRKPHWQYAMGEIRQEFGQLTIKEGHINLWRYKDVTVHPSFRIVP